jgi:hypothetical protein
MKLRQFILSLLIITTTTFGQKVFDVHIHGDKDIATQLKNLQAQGVYKVAISTSWKLQDNYNDTPNLKILKGLMLACPNGKVPYSDNFCFEDQKEFPDLIWVEEKIKDGKIHFIGEVLSQYYGISPSSEKLYPYYELAQKYNLPVGIHTGLAGPNHGSPNFKVGLGNPILLEDLLQKFPNLKVWIMHSGAPYIEDTIAIMSYYWNVYADISAISNPKIFPPSDFKAIMKRLIDAGLENRLMFGSDNGNIEHILSNFNTLDFLSPEQKEKILYKNAEKFFLIQ